MSATIKHFSVVEYIQELKRAKFTDEQAQVVARIFEQQAETIQDQRIEIDALKAKEPATKSDIYEMKHEIKQLELKIEQYRYDSLKFIVWTGIGITFTLLVTLGGMLAKGFHWF